MVFGQSMEFYDNKNKECDPCEGLKMTHYLNTRAKCSEKKTLENRLLLQLGPKPFKPPTAVDKNHLLCGPEFYKYSSGISDESNVEQEHLEEHGFLDSPCRKAQNVNFVLPRPSSLYFNSENQSVLSRPSKFYLKPETEDDLPRQLEFIDYFLPGRSKLSFDDQVDGVLSSSSSSDQSEPEINGDSPNLWTSSPTSSTDSGIFNSPVSTTPSLASTLVYCPSSTTPEPEEKDKNEEVFSRVSVKNIIAQWEEKKNIKPESSFKKVNVVKNSKIDQFRREKEEELKKEREQEFKKNEEKKLTGEKEGRLKNIIAVFEENLKEKKENNVMKEKPKKLNKLLAQWEEKSKIKPDSSLEKVNVIENSSVNKLKKISEEKLKKEREEKLKKEKLEKLKNEQEKKLMKIFGKKRPGDREDLLEHQKRFKKMTEEEQKILKNTKETVQTLNRLQFKSQMYKAKSLINEQKFFELKKQDDDKIETNIAEYCVESDHEISSLFGFLDEEEEQNNEFETYQITAAEFAMLTDKYNRCEKQVKYSEERFYNNYKNNDDFYYNKKNQGTNYDCVEIDDLEEYSTYKDHQDIQDRKSDLYKANYFQLTFV